MQGIQKYKPLDGVNVDVADKYLKPTESRYLLNTDLIGLNGNDGITTPGIANKAVPYVQPAGENTTIGKHYSKRTQELYVFVYNSLNNHHIYRVNHNGASTTMVLQDPKLGFVLDRKNRINLRAHLYFNNNNFRSRGNKLAYKYLVWTNGVAWQGFLDVETSIATNGFRTAYYNTPDRTIYWQLAPRPSLRCADLAWVAQTDPAKANVMMYSTWQFRIKGIFTDGRETAWSPISDSIFHEKSACESEENFERCVKLTLDAMTPQVEKYVLAYRNCAGNFTTSQNPDWYICDYIDRYAECVDSEMPFYERALNPDLNYDAATNTFSYVYCGNKLCIPIDRQETDRNYNDIPITSYGLFPMDDRLGLANNTYGYEPIICDELEKITFDVVSDLNPACKIEYVTVKVGIVIHNIFEDLNQPIYYKEDDDKVDEHQHFFGGVHNEVRDQKLGFADPFLFKQYFAEKKGDFLVYVEGTPLFAKTRQYKVNSSTHEILGEYYVKNAATHDVGVQLGGNDFYLMSVAEIKVPRGMRGFIRLASHQATTAQDYQRTSTNVYGIMTDRNDYAARMGVEDIVTADEKEIYFDANNVDQDLTDTPFVVADLTCPEQLHFAQAETGYLRAEERVANEVLSLTAVERAQVTLYNNPMRTVTSTVTDHNGYYFASFQWRSDLKSNRVGIDFYAYENCVLTKKANRERDNDLNGGDEKEVLLTGDWYKGNYERVKIKLTDTNGNGISGIKVAAEGGKASTTGADGVATIVVRNAPSETLKFMPMQSGLCPLTMGNCVFTVPVLPVLMPACLSAGTEQYEISGFRPVQVSKGLMPGGSYPIAVKFIDDAGRESNAQGDWTIDMPQIVEQKNFSFSHINFTIPQLNLPPWVSKMALLIGKNRNQEDAISWAVDKVEFVDSAGNDTSAFAADKIRLSIKSLYDMQRRGGNLNAKYLFQQGDRVRFLVNGDTNLYANNIDVIIEGDDNNRDTYEAKSTVENPVDMYSRLLISNAPGLESLVAGAVIQIYKPRVCDNEDYFYETCQLIDVRASFPAGGLKGSINTYDTYLIRRSIAFNNQSNFFSYPFLHHSPSDFWGDHCISRGRISVKNPYEKQVMLGRNMAVSLPFFTNGNVNGLGTFIAQFEKNFGGEQRGDIIAVVSYEGHMLFILQHDNFIASAGDDFVKLDSENRLRANAGEMTISDANSKISGNFGCRYEDVGSLVAGDGWVFWMDYANKAPVLHDFQQASNIAAGKMESYFNKKLAVSADFAAGLDPARNRVYLTIIMDNKSFVHNNHSIEYDKNETLAINLRNKTFEFVSFTPEFYGYHLDYNGEQVLFTFKNAIPYVHTRFYATEYNVYYGQPCDQVFDFILNENPEKVKLPLAMQLQSSVSYWAELITTSQGHISRIVPARSKKITERKHDMEFVCDTNSKGGLYEGTALRGFTTRIRLVRDNTQGVLVNTVDEAKQKSYSELDAVLIKYALSEQSGYRKQ